MSIENLNISIETNIYNYIENKVFASLALTFNTHKLNNIRLTLNLYFVHI